jgi:hypothetical protein
MHLLLILMGTLRGIKVSLKTLVETCPVPGAEQGAKDTDLKEESMEPALKHWLVAEMARGLWKSTMDWVAC